VGGPVRCPSSKGCEMRPGQGSSLRRTVGAARYVMMSWRDANVTTVMLRGVDVWSRHGPSCFEGRLADGRLRISTSGSPYSASSPGLTRWSRLSAQFALGFYRRKPDC